MKVEQLIKVLDPANHDTWPPRYVVLSSLWAFKVVKEENIPQAVRYRNWPTTFNSKSGFQSSWKNRGRPTLVRDEEGTLRYPVVFATTQLHGTEGEQKGLQTTSTAMNVRYKTLDPWSLSVIVMPSDQLCSIITSPTWDSFFRACEPFFLPMTT